MENDTSSTQKNSFKSSVKACNMRAYFAIKATSFSSWQSSDLSLLRKQAKQERRHNDGELM